MWKLIVGVVTRRIAAMLIAMVFGSVAVAQDSVRIVTVNYPLQYFAERLAGEAAEVVFPVPADVDPSFWRPNIADISMIQSADLILLNGAGFATWIDRVSLPRSRLVNTTAGMSDSFIVTESITHSHGDGGEHSHEGLASYLWLDLELAIAQAEAVAAALVSRRISAENEVEKHLATLRAELQALDAQAKRNLADFGEVAIIATHPRYQYLAQRYGLNISSLEWEAGTRPNANELEALGALADQTGARILIWEAAPPAQALKETAALGLKNVVFEPMARTPSSGAFPNAFAEAVAELSSTAQSVAAGN